jgi:uncharacterized protein YbjT (DUF2867 family)
MAADPRAQETILVVGGTGMIGRPVAERLRDDGYRVRVLTRDQERARSLLGEGVEYVRGGVDDAASLDGALEGCSAVYISLKAGPEPGEAERIEHQGTARLAEAAAKAGLARMTYLSGCYVGHEQARDSEAETAKLGAERAIEASGVPLHDL